jgi:hypothetical protein
LSKKIIAILFAVAIVVLNVFYYLGLNTTYYGTTNLVCLNFDNPNAAGLWLTAFFIVLGLSTSIFKSKVVKVGFWLLSFSLVPMINATESRNSLLALIFFVVLYIIAFLVKAKKVNKAFVIFIIVLPIIVFFFYLFIFIPNSDFFNSIFGKGVFGDNKTLTTRAEIWTNCLNDFGKVWMFGDASVGFANLHNSLITLIFKNGILATIVGCIVIYRSLNDMQERGKILSTLALLAFLFTGCFEASFFGGVAGLYLFILIFCAVGKENDK